MVILKKIVHILSILVYMLIIVYAVVCIPIMFSYRPLVVLTGSMEPTFETGSVIYYKKVTSEDELKKGDIITYKTPSNNFISHRIVSVDNGLYETKGDANEIADATKVKFEEIEGKDANVTIPYIGYYVQFINKNLFVIIITILLILVSEFLLSNKEALGINKKNGGKI